MKTRLLFGLLIAMLPGGLFAQTGAGIDLTLSHQLTPRISANIDINLISLNYADESVAQNHLSFAPHFSSSGRLTYQLNKRFAASFYYQLLKEPSSEEGLTPADQGYLTTHTSIQYAFGKFEMRLSLGRPLPIQWHEEQFDVNYEVFDEPDLGFPLNIKPQKLEAKLSFAVRF